jgi:hypothetical protein
MGDLVSARESSVTEGGSKFVNNELEHIVFYDTPCGNALQVFTYALLLFV